MKYRRDEAFSTGHQWAFHGTAAFDHGLSTLSTELHIWQLVMNQPLQHARVEEVVLLQSVGFLPPRKQSFDATPSSDSVSCSGFAVRGRNATLHRGLSTTRRTCFFSWEIGDRQSSAKGNPSMKSLESSLIGSPGLGFQAVHPKTVKTMVDTRSFPQA